VYEVRAPAEKRLVEAAKGGHSPAFATLCERYTQRLLRIAHRITRNREDAEDAVQDALLRAFLHLTGFDGRSSFATWLTRIAINSALMIVRKKRTSLEVALEYPDSCAPTWLPYEPADGSPNPEKICAQRERKEILRGAIVQLRPKIRRVVELQQLQEHSLMRTAEMVGISVTAAKGRLFHARAALRKSSHLKAIVRVGSRERAEMGHIDFRGHAAG
jgi:RNA polymerase sigma-70 factor (ECF subfamily)